MSIDTGSNQSPKTFRVLGIPISIIDIAGATTFISRWADTDRPRTVFVREVASLMAAVDEPRLGELHEKADLLVADGTPLVWVGRALGHGKELGRVPGADLVDALCRRSLSTGQSHYFYGGKPGVAAEMARRLTERNPGLKVAGVFSPPMRDFGPDLQPDAALLTEIEAINASGADFIWVGLSSPKQEYLMMTAAPRLKKGVLLGVGAAFDFHSGAIQRAPAWLRNNGLEWLHRLYSEPSRLWRRYLILAPRFVIAVIPYLLSMRLRQAKR
jgi:N-acetylglucosaminyldiphosphoundecaprenol N-acetyl-beta-D-mannosaminyltransferase